MAASKGARKRSANFTENEKALLLGVVEKYKSVVENKTTTAVVTDMKTKAWKEITATYNSLSDVARELQTLRLCYDNIKKKAKKVAAQDKGTGGGPQDSKMDEIGPKIIGVMGNQLCFNLENTVGSDGVYVVTRADDSSSQYEEETSDDRSNVRPDIKQEVDSTSCSSLSLEIFEHSDQEVSKTVECVPSLPLPQRKPSTASDVSCTNSRGPRMTKSHHRSKGANKTVIRSDEFDAMATVIACKLRRMDDSQRNIAEHLCNTVLYYGLQNRLEESSSVSCLPPDIESRPLNDRRP